MSWLSLKERIIIWQFHTDKEVKRKIGIIEYLIKNKKVVASNSGFQTKKEAIWKQVKLN